MKPAADFQAEWSSPCVPSAGQPSSYFPCFYGPHAESRSAVERMQATAPIRARRTLATTMQALPPACLARWRRCSRRSASAATGRRSRRASRTVWCRSRTSRRCRRGSLRSRTQSARFSGCARWLAGCRPLRVRASLRRGLRSSKRGSGLGFPRGAAYRMRGQSLMPAQSPMPDRAMLELPRPTEGSPGCLVTSQRWSPPAAPRAIATHRHRARRSRSCGSRTSSLPPRWIPPATRHSAPCCG